MQSICYDHTISLLRRSMRDPAKLSMGSLFWQLNDVWQGASWSSFDYEGRWKPLHHALSRVYAPLQMQALVVPGWNDRAEVLLAYDEAAPLPATVTVDVYLHSLAAGDPAGDAPAVDEDDDVAPTCLAGAGKTGARQLVGSFTIEQGTMLDGKPSWGMDVAQLLNELPGCTRQSCYVRAVAREVHAGEKAGIKRRGGAKSLLGVGRGQVQEAVVFLSKLATLDLPEVSVRAFAFKQLSPNSVEFRVAASGGAAVHAFWDAAPAGKFSVNELAVLEPCRVEHVRFDAVHNVSAADLEKSLTVWTMNGALLGRQRAAAIGKGAMRAARRGATPSRRMLA